MWPGRRRLLVGLLSLSASTWHPPPPRGGQNHILGSATTHSNCIIMFGSLIQALFIAPLRLGSSSAATHAHDACGFHLPLKLKPKSYNIVTRSTCMITSPKVHSLCNALSRLDMVRNIDLPEALVFYGIESMMEPIHEIDTDDTTHQFVPCTLRPGIVRLINECGEVGTAALLICEEFDEDCLKRTFQKAYERVSCSSKDKLQLRKSSGNDPAVQFRCLNSVFESELDDEYDNNLELYNLEAVGRSPSPAFLLDSLRSVSIDPRGFGGSSGFGRGQWIEPRRCPMPARTVVFVAGDWISPQKGQHISEEERKNHVKDRCTAARLAGCRVIYVEHIPNPTPQKIATTILDDLPTMALCDAVIDTFGNDNPRDLQSITLDAISTPGDFWLNPPSPRDDMGNAVSVDEIVELFRSERVESKTASKNANDEDAVAGNDNDMSEEEMKAILADLDG